MTILILNWRDIKNPAGGGAEILTHELAKRWVKHGHSVMQISSSFKMAKTNETIDGVQFIRKGTWWTVQIYAYFYYKKYLKDKTDIIIDEVHWFPFFSYLYAPKKTVALICEVANKLLYQIFPYPVALMWRFIEKIYLIAYRNVPAMAISQSTYDDLVEEGHIKKNLIVLPMGLTLPVKIKHFAKEKTPTLIYVARLNKQKGLFDTIQAFALIKSEIKEAKLWLVGSGDPTIINQVKKQITLHKLDGAVKLFGFVSEEKKFELLSRAHILMSASAQEGWGLTVPEAGLTRTPAVVYNIQGFRDIIQDGKEGMLVDKNPGALANGVVALLNKKELYKKMQDAVEKKAKSFSWDTSAEKSLQFINYFLDKK
ncbi:MAG: glycosyltransferase family 4 protein [Candidatus Levyibacteriota bacterium]